MSATAADPKSCKIGPAAELLPHPLCPVFTRAPKLSLTLHSSRDGSRVAVIQHVRSDGSRSIFLSLSCALAVTAAFQDNNCQTRLIISGGEKARLM